MSVPHKRNFSLNNQDSLRRLLLRSKEGLDQSSKATQEHPITQCLVQDASVLWFNPSQQLSTMQPLTPPCSQWDGEEDREKKVKLVG